MDCTFSTAEGKFNYRVGAIIRNGNKILMARNPNESREFYYSVGGRVMLGETAEAAILRELKEETGLCCEIERLAAIHENFFEDGKGIPFHEISLFFLIKISGELSAIQNGHHTDGGPSGEFLEWLAVSGRAEKVVYPDFFMTTDFSKERGVLHFVTREI